MAAGKFIFATVAAMAFTVSVRGQTQEIQIVDDDMHILSTNGDVMFKTSNNEVSSSKQINTNKADIEGLQSMDVQLQSKLDMANANLTVHKGKLEKIQGDMTSALGDITRGGASTDDIGTQLQKLFDLISGIDGNISNINSNIESVKADIMSINATMQEALNSTMGNGDMINSVKTMTANNTQELARVDNALEFLLDANTEIYHEETVYGPWVIGDDRPSPARCPIGTKPISCTWENQGSGTDGTRLSTINQEFYADCIVYAKIHETNQIRSKLTCTNAYPDVTAVQGEYLVQKENQDVQCHDDEFFMTDCHCYSPWGGCDESKLKISDDKSTCTYQGTPPRRSTVYAFCAKLTGFKSVKVAGPVIKGNDHRSRAECPHPLKLTQCDAHTYAGRADGIQVNAMGTFCDVRGYNNAPVRAEATCSNTFTDVAAAVGKPLPDLNQTVTCEDGYDALECYCYSPWGLCTKIKDVPTNNGTCVMTKRDDERWAQTSALCGKV